MWTFHDFPSVKVKTRYGFGPDQAWLDKARLSSARLAGICSASFVSDSGLVMTNHHCAHDCVAGLSTSVHDYVKEGYLAKTADDEKKCPNLEVQRLDETTDVTAQVTKATAGKSGAAFTAALREISAAIEKPCQTGSDIRCEVVNLYHGGQFMLYRYKRYTDVRVVFAPELAIAFFGGDPDNFEFPRYDLDVSFVRAYENGKPAATPEHFGWSPAGPKAGELSFVAGDPAQTERGITTAERVFDRDVVGPIAVSTRAEWRGQLTQFMRETDEQRRIGTEWQFYNENSLKAYKGRQAALGDDAMMNKLADAEAETPREPEARETGRRRLHLDREGAREVQAVLSPLLRARALDQGRPARSRGRAGARRRRACTLPDGKRLDEYRDSALPDLEQKLASVAPIYPDRDKLALAYWLGKLREELGADDPLVAPAARQGLARRSRGAPRRRQPPRRSGRAHAPVEGRQGGGRFFARSDDPVREARSMPAARKVRKSWDDDVEGVERSAGEQIAKAKFALEGRASYPDATFTLRLSYGSVKGYVSSAHGTKVAPFTYFGGAYARATGAPPFDLPPTWLDARKQRGH